MNPKRKRRLTIIIGLVCGLSVAVGFGAYAMRHSIDLFVTPGDIAAGTVPTNQRISVGGLVVDGSLKRGDGLTIHFDVSDNKSVVAVSYDGILPDLFREGKGIVVKGMLTEDGRVVANEVLAKHDENYMPPEAKAAIEKAGHPKGV
ncbi:Cytochrome C-type biogenesis protein, periplasmic heme chaperone [gamma proteobacterium HdN1]|nr:Cytochrome C-type biogenesis protein, periplasmic heme chaperone [gamma proteobacterium HdN1]